MEIKPKYYLKRKLKNGDIALIPCADPPQEQEPDPAGLKKLTDLKAQYPLKSMSGSPAERTKDQEETVREERKLKWK